MTWPYFETEFPVRIALKMFELKGAYCFDFQTTLKITV